MYGILVLAVLNLIPTGHEVLNTVDVIEINHVYSLETGDKRFTQVIYWQWTDGELRVVDWRMLRTAGQRPRKNGSLWVSRYRESGIDRKIVATAFRVRHSYHDPEIDDRREHPVSMRAKLASP